MQVGIKGEEEVHVTKRSSWHAMSAAVWYPVFATPMMIAAIENTACRQCSR